MRQLLLLVLLVGLTVAAKSRKKIPSKSEETTKFPSAIIAIQIVDPKENATGSKNFKRTIDAALGYGYQKSSPRYEVYKYSQHDIPPFSPPKGYNPFTKVEIQKSVEYKLPTTSVVQPGTTLFSTINQNGHVGKLSSTLPQSTGAVDNVPVPVIILRVLPGQLTNPNVPLHPNLPQSHPYAANINQLDIQSLLSKYISSLSRQNYVQPTAATVHDTGRYQQQPSKQYLPVAPNYQQYQYQPQQYETTVEHQQYYQPAQQYQEPANQQYEEPAHQQYQEPAHQQYQEPTHQQYQEQAYYSQQLQQYYQEPQHKQYQYQQYDDKEARPYSSSGLLTHENYPSPKHTKVVFKTKKGSIKTASEQPPVETKTIQIQLPENIQDVQVQESYTYPNQQEQQAYQQDQQAYQQDQQAYKQDQQAYQQDGQGYQQDGQAYQPEQQSGGGSYYYYQQGAQQEGYSEDSSNVSPYKIDISKTSGVTNEEILSQGGNKQNYHTRRRVKSKKRNTMKPRPVREENVE